MKHSLIYTILILSLTFSCQDDDTITEPEATADTTVPLLTLTGPPTVDLIKGDTYTDLGATAVDNIDGDLSSSIVVSGDAVNIEIEGIYVITYNVSDAAGNTALELLRTVNVGPADNTIPVIALIGDSMIELTVGDAYTDQGALATDDQDGVITSSIVVGGDIVDTNSVGVYVITYNVSDAAGNAAVELNRSVKVIAEVQSITGSWERLVYDELGNSDSRILTFEEDLSGIQKEVMPFTYSPCPYVSCPIYVPVSTWHITFTYTTNEADNTIDIDYNYYFDYSQFGQTECEYCQPTSYYVEDVASAVVDLEAGTITFPATGYNASFVYTKIE